MSEKQRVAQTEVHKVDTEKDPVRATETCTDKKGSKISDAAKEASRTDDTVV